MEVQRAETWQPRARIISQRPAWDNEALRYDLYETEFGEDIEVHFFRHPDGSVGDVKIK